MRPRSARPAATTAVAAVVAVAVALALAAAPRRARADQPAAPAAPPPAPVIVPADLAVASESGIRVGADTIFSGPVGSAALDADQDLVWFTSNGTLQVIDLRDRAPKPVVIVTHMPEVGFRVEGVSHAEENAIYTNAYLVLTLDKKPRVHAESAVYEVVDPDGTKKLRRAIGRAKLVGRAWIKAQLARAPRPGAAPAARKDPPAVTLPAGLGHCDDTGDCGTAFWLGATPYEEVIVMGACGDACFRGCALYDPATQRFAPAGDGGAWGKLTDDTKNVNCMDIVVAPAGDRYYVGSTVCTIGAAMTCTDLGSWRAIGWRTPAAAAP